MALLPSSFQSPSCDSSPQFYIHKENEESPSQSPHPGGKFHHPTKAGKIPSPSIHKQAFTPLLPGFVIQRTSLAQKQSHEDNQGFQL